MAKSQIFIFGAIVMVGRLIVYWIMELGLFLSKLSQEEQLIRVFLMDLGIGVISRRLIQKMDMWFMVERRSNQELPEML